MRKAKALRITGFVGALCASAALVGTSVSGTGAYFTDSHSGSISSSSGHLRLDNVGPTTLNFAGLMPGTDASADIPYTVNVTSGKVDVWMVFDPTSAGYGEFTGNKNTDYDGYTGGGMGRYGHFQVGDNGDIAFQSYNLQLASDPADNCSDGTVPGPDGRGGSSVESATNQECGVPAAILLATDQSNGASGDVHVVFGLTGKQTQQGQTEATVGYQLVATQAGHRPDDPNTP